MTFSYTYRTSDGVRHTSEIDAKRREDAFAALRAQGIRPIRVEEKPMTPRERIRRAVLWAAAAVVLAACAAGVWACVRHARYQRETRAAFDSLKARAEAERTRHREDFGKVDFALLRNYALVERSKDITFALEEIARGKGVVEASRVRVKDLFRDLYDLFPPESSNERLDAQRLYGEIMNEIDASEERLDAEECVLALLDENRDKWHVQNGRLLFSDVSLEREVGFFRKDTDGSALRWKRDFGRSGIESAPVELPHAAAEKKQGK